MMVENGLILRKITYRNYEEALEKGLQEGLRLT